MDNILKNSNLRGRKQLYSQKESRPILIQWRLGVGRVGRLWVSSDYWLNSRENLMLRRLLSFKRSLQISKRRL